MIELHEGWRGRVLPPPANERTTISPYHAHLACDADARTVSPPIREVAETLVLVEAAA